MGSIFKGLGKGSQRLFGHVPLIKHLVPGGAVSNKLDVGDFFTPPDATPSTDVGPKPTAPIVDDATAAAESQRRLARLYATRGREGTVLAGTGTNNLG